MTDRVEARLLEKIETKLGGESTRFIGIYNAPRAFEELMKLSTFQLKVLFENLVDQEFIVGAPLGDMWGPPAIAAQRDKNYIAQWVKEGLEALTAWRYREGR